MNFDAILRWWAALTLAVSAPVIGGFIENLSVLSPAAELGLQCQLPLLTQSTMPLIRHATEFGLAIGAATIVTLAASFRLAATEIGRYRALTIVSYFGWVTVALGAVQSFLALFVIPLAKCG